MARCVTASGALALADLARHHGRRSKYITPAEQAKSENVSAAWARLHKLGDLMLDQLSVKIKLDAVYEEIERLLLEQIATNEAGDIFEEERKEKLDKLDKEVAEQVKEWTSLMRLRKEHKKLVRGFETRDRKEVVGKAWRVEEW
jgi:hypothetical protein